MGVKPLEQYQKFWNLFHLHLYIKFSAIKSSYFSLKSLTSSASCTLDGKLFHWSTTRQLKKFRLSSPLEFGSSCDIAIIRNTHRTPCSCYWWHSLASYRVNCWMQHFKCPYMQKIGVRQKCRKGIHPISSLTRVPQGVAVASSCGFEHHDERWDYPLEVIISMLKKINNTLLKLLLDHGVIYDSSICSYLSTL